MIQSHKLQQREVLNLKNQTNVTHYLIKRLLQHTQTLTLALMSLSNVRDRTELFDSRLNLESSSEASFAKHLLAVLLGCFCEVLRLLRTSSHSM